MLCLTNSASPVRSAYDVPAAAQASTSGSPRGPYGPTVLTTTLADRASTSIDS